MDRLHSRWYGSIMWPISIDGIDFSTGVAGFRSDSIHLGWIHAAVSSKESLWLAGITPIWWPSDRIYSNPTVLTDRVISIYRFFCRSDTPEWDRTKTMERRQLSRQPFWRSYLTLSYVISETSFFLSDRSWKVVKSSKCSRSVFGVWRRNPKQTFGSP